MLKVFGREQLLAAGDIPMAQFVRWQAHFHTRPCRIPDSSLRNAPALTLGGPEPAAPMPSVGDAAAGGIVTECIVGARGVAGPFMVMLDGQRLQYSDELWAHKAWDLGRVEVIYQRSAVDAPFGTSFARPFAFVRLYTVGYLARVAARVTTMCDHIASADTIANAYLASLCGP